MCCHRRGQAPLYSFHNVARYAEHVLGLLRFGPNLFGWPVVWSIFRQRGQLRSRRPAHPRLPIKGDTSIFFFFGIASASG